MKRSSDEQLAYGLLRFTFGLNLAMHGVSRILSGVGQFAAKTAADFGQTLLPKVLVWPFAAALPYLELSVGVLLVFGLFTRPAIVCGSLLMAALAFGTALRADWAILGTQLLYSLVYYVLLMRLRDNALSIDGRRVEHRARVAYQPEVPVPRQP